jgi:hypothetical protein
MKIILALFMLLIASPAWTADGDSLGGATTNYGSYKSSAYKFCDGKVAADPDSCSEFDLASKGGGTAKFAIFNLDSVVGCAGGYKVEIYGRTTTGGAQHLWGTLDVDTTSLRVDGPTHRFIDAITVDTGCSGAGLSVNMVLYYEN